MVRCKPPVKSPALRPDGELPILRLKPLAQAIALLMVAGSAHGATAFSSGWFADKGASQAATAARTNGQVPGIPPLSQQTRANQQLQRSLSNLNSSVAAIAAQQAAQAAARQAAFGTVSTIPDGLGEGGLKVDNSLTQGWLNAKGPVQSQSGGKTTVTIEQTADKAILNWETFNVGRNTTVDFQQQSNWALLNKVNDPNGRPSEIQGQIKGAGTVMIMNRNGVIFSGTSQVNVRNLVAAAATISDEQFTQRGLYVDANGTQPTFSDALGKVQVQRGALIQTHPAATSTESGGYALLLGSEVENAGTIVTAKGQTTLAAGDSFYIRRGVGTSGNQHSTTRGNEVATSLKAGSSAGKVSNSGLIMASTGDITLTGHQVAQNGVALASTSVDTRGTIHLLNSASDSTGSVTLGQGSTTAILLDSSGSSALDSQRNNGLINLDGTPTNLITGQFNNLSSVADRSDQSRVEIVSGGTVDFQDGSITLATGGQVAVSAGQRSLVRDGAVIDVAGAVGVKVAMESNNIKINVQGNEQRDSAGNRDSGQLINNDVWVDLRDLVFVPAGTNGYATDRWYTAGGLLEVGGYLGTQGHNIGEWMAQGGTLTFTGKDVVTQSGAQLNLSGGTVDVQGGYIQQTWLKGADGRLYELSRAPGDLLYTGIYKGYVDSSPRWGRTDYYYNPLIAQQRRYEAGYSVGRDAGKLVIGTSNAVLEGQLVSEVFKGDRQTQAPNINLDGYQQSHKAAAQRAQLIIGNYTPIYNKTSGTLRYALSPSVDKVLIEANQQKIADGLDLATALPANRQGQLVLDSDQLNGFQLGAIKVGARQQVQVNGALKVADGGDITLFGPEVKINANLTAHGGSINAGNVLNQVDVNRNFVVGDVILAPTGGAQARVDVASGVKLDASGRWNNLALDASDSSGLAFINGGKVSLRSSGDLNLANGTQVDASSGASIAYDGKTSGGKGGDVTLAADGKLDLDGELRGYGVNGGGTLALQAHKVLIGAHDPAPEAGTLQLAGDFFNKGFGAYDITGNEGLTVAEGAQVEVNMPVYRFGAQASSSATGSDPATVLECWLPQLYQQDATRGVLTQRRGAGLTLNAGNQYSTAAQLATTALSVGQGAVISVDPGQAINLRSVGQLTLNGTLNAWGGSVSLGGLTVASSEAANAAGHGRSIWVGEQAVIDVAARAVSAVDNRGRRYGQVRNGGKIAIGGEIDLATGIAKASDLFVVVREGARLDASGAQAALDIPGQGRVQVASNGGSISFASNNGLYLDGSFVARAGGAGAAGGTLSLALESPYYIKNAVSDRVLKARELVLSQTHQGSALPASADAAAASLEYGHGRLGVDQVTAGGFDNLALLSNGLLSFDGDVSLNMGQSLRLYSGALNLSESAAANSRVDLSAPYLLLAGILAPLEAKDQYVRPVSTGTPSQQATQAQFNASGNLIDVRGNVVFGSKGTLRQADNSLLGVERRGFDHVQLTSQGDLRFLAGAGADVIAKGISTQLLTQGDMTLRAAQLYPGTEVGARVIAGYLNDISGTSINFDPTRTLAIGRTGQGEAPVPYSAFGRLQLGAANIQQGGVVRAPLGLIEIGNLGASKVELLPGSLTSVSGKGLVLPYGGTVDGQVYKYNGKTVTFLGQGALVNENSDLSVGVILGGKSVQVQPDATVDLSGGGELLGAGFISGRGGSTDARYSPLVQIGANGSFILPGLGSNPIYAIVPGVQPGYAPVAPEGGAVDPLIGQQITIGAGVPGLAAGTYTLMPSTYALMPGAFRVEINGLAGLGTEGATQPLRNGSWSTAGRLSIAHTGISNSVASQLILTSADTLRRYSQYNETGYAQFALADAAKLGVPRPMLPVDAKTLKLALEPGAGADAFSFKGIGRFDAAAGGYGGTVAVLNMGSGNIEVVAAGKSATQGFNGVTLDADSLNAMGAARLMLGGLTLVKYGQGGNYITVAEGVNTPKGSITLREGATLAAPEVFLVSNTGEIVLEQGASINTLGRGKASYDARDGFTYQVANMLAVSNGLLNVISKAQAGGQTSGGIRLGVCASAPCSGQTALYSDGSIVALTDNAFELGDQVRYGTRHLNLGLNNINVGSPEALAAAAAGNRLPSGMTLTQQLLDRLLRGDTQVGAPALETLQLSARDGFNFYGSASLDTYDPATGKSLLSNLMLSTPAIYGAGGANDVASIHTANLIWQGSETPAGAVVAGGAGTGSGRLQINAERIEFGYGAFAQPSTTKSFDRLALGFANVDLNASQRITANHKGSLSVYQSQGAFDPLKGFAYSGGNLNILTPLMTGEAGSVNRITAGGAMDIGASAGPRGQANGQGAELSLQGDSIRLASAVVLPSGKVTLGARGDVSLTDAALIDVAGRTIAFNDLSKYGAGGEVLLQSATGNVLQATGSTIDLSATHNQAGKLRAVALDGAAGRVDLAGKVLGGSSGYYDAGGTLVPFLGATVEIQAQHLGSSGTLDEQFAALNQRLNQGQVFGARSFQLKQGDLTIGDGVRASTVNVSVDNGSLRVTGRVDASGERVGSINLAAGKGLTLDGSAVLDAHGSKLRVDSYGKIIDSPNRALIELNAGDGLLSLGAGARIDLRHGTEAAAGSAPGQNDGVARGTLDLYAPRLGGATAGDIAIDAGAPLQILGVRAITLSAVQRYDDAPVAALPASNGRPYQEITQAYLDGKHQQSELFMQAALANSTLLDGKLAGLNNATYAEAFHLRPGLEIVSATADGDLVVQGDLDLSGHRYASLNPRRAKTSVYGSGEAGSLAIRAGGDLNIYGSVTDGFAPPPETDDDQGWLLLAGQDHLGGDRVVPTAGVRLDDDSFFPAGKTLNFELPIKAMTLAAGTRLPVEAVLSQPLQLPAGTVLEGALLDAAGNLLRPAGSLLGEALDLPAGTRLGAGSRLPLATPVTGMTWPGGVPLPGRATLANDEVDGVRLAGGLALRAGAFLPAGSDIRLPDGAASVDVRPAGAVSHNWAIAPMLAAGSQSWSVRLVAGADLQAADPRLTDPRSSGQMRLADTHYGMRRIPAAGGGLVWTQEGVDNWGDPSLKPGDPLDPEALGYPTICDDFPTWCAASSGGMVWTEEGVAGWGDPGIKPGDPLDPEALGYPTICDDFPTWCAASSDDYALEAEPYASRFSVLRTGTGDLDLFAAGNLRMDSPFGVYTAGTASAVDSSYNLARARDGGSVLRDPALGGYEQWVDGGEQSLYSAWYPTLGGNLTLAVGGDLRGDVLGRLSGAVPNAGYDSAAVGNWLWRQGSGSTAGTADRTAWWINFGTYARQPGGDGAAAATQQVGFTGIGTLGGGDLSLKVAGDAGVIEARTSSVPQETSQRSQGLVLAVGGSGRVGADGQLTLSGGGDMDVRIGGALNPLTPFDQGSSLYGAMVNLRGNAQVRATSLGGIDLIYGRLDSDQVPGERRAYDPFVSTLGLANGGPTLVPGDATFSLNSLGDLVLQGVVDPGRTPLMNGTPYTSASGVEGYGLSGFSLWTERTAIDLTSAGGNLTPVSQGRTEQDTDSALVYPAKLSAVALTGSLYYGNATLRENARSDRTALVLAPSSQGRLDLLAGDSIYAGGYSISRSGASTGSLATPLNPSYQGYTGITRQVDNLSSDGSRADTNHFPLFAFGANSVSGEWGAALEPSRFYALAGDLVGVDSGRLLRYTGTSDVRFGQLRYEGHGAVRMIAGRDIVSSGTGLGSERTASDNMGVYASSGNLFVNTSATDVSLVQAGRDILYGNFNVAGPGSLEISAGRNLLMNDEVAVTSLGAVAAGDTRSGASIVLQAGASQADYSGFLRRYLELDNLAQAGTPLAEQPGKVVRTYENELIEWLSGRYGFSGDAQQAREFLAGLSAEQQRIFAREVYFAELKAGGREYNEVGGVRQGSYLRGRNAIAALFPERDPAGNPISYEGDIVMYGGAGVHTNFGGDIQLLTPGGQQVFGIEGEAPPSTAGVVTQGVGNIRSYALSSILLGQSRVMTTFGGDIQIWSAEGDINAGRGSKTTVVYTPPRRIYDAWGNVSLSPQVPSTGAGIATLNPIPEVAPGDIDLIAPLGTIDAGEAGIRVSGNVNVAALQVVNAANIQTQGQSSGIPLVASVNTGALTSASAAASSATQAAEDVSRQQQAAARQRMPSVITVQVLGFGNERLEPSRDGASRSPGYNPDSAVQVLGAGALGEQARSQLTDEERGNLIL